MPGSSVAPRRAIDDDGDVALGGLEERRGHRRPDRSLQHPVHDRALPRPDTTSTIARAESSGPMPIVTARVGTSATSPQYRAFASIVVGERSTTRVGAFASDGRLVEPRWPFVPSPRIARSIPPAPARPVERRAGRRPGRRRSGAGPRAPRRSRADRGSSAASSRTTNAGLPRRVPRYSSSWTAVTRPVSSVPRAAAPRQLRVQPHRGVAGRRTTEAVGVASRSRPRRGRRRPGSSALVVLDHRDPQIAHRSASADERGPEAVPVAPVDHLAQLDLPAGLVLGLLLAPQQRLARLAAPGERRGARRRRSPPP